MRLLVDVEPDAVSGLEKTGLERNGRAASRKLRGGTTAPGGHENYRQIKRETAHDRTPLHWYLACSFNVRPRLPPRNATRETSAVNVTRTYVEMLHAADLKPAKGPADMAVARVRPCTPALYRFLYGEVGRRYQW